eukprot:TRINITY_DN7712_c0_g3_i3.p1 TRINITY_DN7712_c0_g3~~TRINITY_DN7712_c0_g3_i3.p1  ORF type:complete len:106 (-),score=10.97 TRINITY_DN7712_c0_g3_i3:36-308(-)
MVSDCLNCTLHFSLQFLEIVHCWMLPPSLWVHLLCYRGLSLLPSSDFFVDNPSENQVCRSLPLFPFLLCFFSFPSSGFFEMGFNFDWRFL